MESPPKPEVKMGSVWMNLPSLVSFPRSLPAEIGSLPLLEELDVSRNSLRVLPAEICQLSRLRVLNVMANQLERLPENIGQLKEVHRLGLKSNKLT